MNNAHKVLAVFFSTVFIIGCTSQLQRGVNAFNSGNYDEAATHWNPLAKAGDKYAEYNLGLLWENGLGSTQKNVNEASQWYLRSANQGFVPAMVRLAILQKNGGYEEAALSWFTLAARWGNQDAIANLKAWGKSIPSPDLLIAKKQKDAIAEQQAAAALSNAAYSIGCVLGGGSCVSGQTYYPTPTPSSYSYQGESATPETVYSEKQCTSDYGCGMGFTCVKAPLKSSGICMKSVNEYGTRQFNSPHSSSVGVNLDLEGQCRFNTDCPVGFKCDSKLKACVK